MAVDKADVLVVSPHPDDAEFGIAGTVALWAQQGKQVVYVVCTSGDKGNSDVNIKPEELAKIREQEQRDAARVLGVREVIFLRYPDQGLEDTPEFRKEIVRYIRMYQPDIVAAPNPYRRYVGHRDHRIAGQVVLDAVYPYARDHLAYPDLMEQGLKPHKVKELFFWATSDDINYYSDITSTFDIKLAALRCHKSQVGNRLSTGLGKMLRQRARSMAEGKGFELAEGFHREEITL